MEKPKNTVQRQQEGLKIVVKSKDGREKGKPVMISRPKSADEQINRSQIERASPCVKAIPAAKKEKKVKDFMDAVSQYRFKNVFQAETSKKRNIIEWGSPNNPFFQKRKPSGTNMLQLVLSIGGAILIGTVMGFSVLQLFFSDRSVHSTYSIDNHLPHATEAKKKGDSAPPSTTAAGLTLPPLKVVMMQAGNFSEKGGAEKTVHDYRTRGLAAVMSQKAPYRIFLGIGLNRDDALKLSAIYQQQDVHVYLKELNIQGKPDSLQDETVAQLSSMIQTGHRLLEQLGKLSVLHIDNDSNKTPSSFSFNQELTAQYRKFVTESQTVESALPEKARESLSDMISAMDLAIQSGQEAEKNPSQALLWQIQEGLLRYATSYEQFVQAVSK
ncbi:hypothetical protein ACFO25_11945 [Paenactinomyces guangxiensis]|uniref:Stage II sporulation protein B n=1 Tax=Paenactinomyces guangxiensis TaxID=1490290 RepID=A0A7W1WUM1_9BACL|nr:hypothetical protein [Paenactinomyces guangxiensis]MBA4496151.1 hypothetical protein [Paenactinomyces guangxiensis]MBH8593239.1 hypothetical protein [Paenactinomyces guangxiensis]